MRPPPDTPEFARFTAAMRQIMKVSKVELNKRIAEEKRKPKTSSSASRDSGEGAKPN